MINYSMWELNYTIFVLNILAQGLQENQNIKLSLFPFLFHLFLVHEFYS